MCALRASFGCDEGTDTTPGQVPDVPAEYIPRWAFEGGQKMRPGGDKKKGPIARAREIYSAFLEAP